MPPLSQNFCTPVISVISEDSVVKLVKQVQTNTKSCLDVKFYESRGAMRTEDDECVVLHHWNSLIIIIVK